MLKFSYCFIKFLYKNNINITNINPGNLKKPIKQIVIILIGIIKLILNHPHIKLYTYKNIIPIKIDSIAFLKIFFIIPPFNTM
jgi:hypothetical protein